MDVSPTEDGHDIVARWAAVKKGDLERVDRNFSEKANDVRRVVQNAAVQMDRLERDSMIRSLLEILGKLQHGFRVVYQLRMNTAIERDRLKRKMEELTRLLGEKRCLSEACELVPKAVEDTVKTRTAEIKMLERELQAKDLCIFELKDEGLALQKKLEKARNGMAGLKELLFEDEQKEMEMEKEKMREILEQRDTRLHTLEEKTRELNQDNQDLHLQLKVSNEEVQSLKLALKTFLYKQRKLRQCYRYEKAGRKLTKKLYRAAIRDKARLTKALDQHKQQDECRLPANGKMGTKDLLEESTVHSKTALEDQRHQELSEHSDVMTIAPLQAAATANEKSLSSPSPTPSYSPSQIPPCGVLSAPPQGETSRKWTPISIKDSSTSHPERVECKTVTLAVFKCPTEQRASGLPTGGHGAHPINDSATTPAAEPPYILLRSRILRSPAGFQGGLINVRCDHSSGVCPLKPLFALPNTQRHEPCRPTHEAVTAEAALKRKRETARVFVDLTADGSTSSSPAESEHDEEPLSKRVRSAKVQGAPTCISSDEESELESESETEPGLEPEPVSEPVSEPVPGSVSGSVSESDWESESKSESGSGNSEQSTEIGRLCTQFPVKENGMMVEEDLQTMLQNVESVQEKERVGEEGEEGSGENQDEGMDESSGDESEGGDEGDWQEDYTSRKKALATQPTNSLAYPPASESIIQDCWLTDGVLCRDTRNNDFQGQKRKESQGNRVSGDARSERREIFQITTLALRDIGPAPSETDGPTSGTHQWTAADPAEDGLSSRIPSPHQPNKQNSSTEPTSREADLRSLAPELLIPPTPVQSAPSNPAQTTDIDSGLWSAYFSLRSGLSQQPPSPSAVNQQHAMPIAQMEPWHRSAPSNAIATPKPTARPDHSPHASIATPAPPPNFVNRMLPRLAPTNRPAPLPPTALKNSQPPSRTKEYHLSHIRQNPTWQDWPRSMSLPLNLASEYDLGETALYNVRVIAGRATLDRAVAMFVRAAEDKWGKGAWGRKWLTSSIARQVRSWVKGGEGVGGFVVASNGDGGRGWLMEGDRDERSS